MKRIIALAALLPSTALAHPGDHSAINATEGLGHLLSEPDHLTMIALAALLVGLLIWLRSGRAE